MGDEEGGDLEEVEEEDMLEAAMVEEEDVKEAAAMVDGTTINMTITYM